MRLPPLFLVLLASASLCLAQQPSVPSSAATPEKVQTEDGRSFLGIVTIKDNYTILISTDTGLTNLPIAALKGDSWKKYSKDDVRSGDGRFWSERQDSLTKGWEKGGKSQPLDLVLAEIVPHLGEIASFKASQPPAEPKKPGAQPSVTPDATVVEINLFSGPGGFGGGKAPSLPGLPGIPSAPSSIPTVP